MNTIAMVLNQNKLHLVREACCVEQVLDVNVHQFHNVHDGVPLQVSA